MAPISQWLRLPSAVFFRPVDERIYAVVRIAFSFVALLNLIFLWPARQAFFSSAGFVDLNVAILDAKPVFLSIFGFVQSEAGVSAILIVTAIALVLLMAGIRPRIMALWVLIWHVSYMARAPLPLAGWDLVLRCFSFLVLVSPIGNCWTLPALLRGSAANIPVVVPRYGLILMRLQLLVIYWQAVLARFYHPDPYWKNGEFLTYFMLSHNARWPGTWVLQYSSVLALATWAIQISEVAIPLLLWVKKTRWRGALLGLAVHGGISVLTQDIGLFGLAMVMCYTAFLQTEDVAGLDRWIRKWARKLVPGRNSSPTTENS